VPLISLHIQYIHSIRAAYVQVVRPRNGSERTRNTDLSILDHEIVFWFGDLNYRIDEGGDKNSNNHPSSYGGFNDNNSLDLNKIYELIERKDFTLMKKKDQLNVEREKGNVFQSFIEGDLTFAPTYKYQPNTNHYERRPEKKIRAPAWCDRILYKTKNKKFLSVKQMNYFRSELLPSDHKPVGSFFDCTLRVIINEKENLTYRDLMKKLEYWNMKRSDADRQTESALPKVTITGLKMKNLVVKYDVTSTSTIEIKNIGDEIVHWRFVPKLDDTKICKKWISVRLAYILDLITCLFIVP
jgi:inositol polyphosphate 5-phosphatase INPP5B/F